MGHFEKGRWISDIPVVDSPQITTAVDIEVLCTRIENLEQAFVDFMNHYRATSWIR